MAKIIKLNPKIFDEKVFSEAAKILENGGLVVFPTETVYGIAANLLSKPAMERLKKLKDRPQDKQFSIHIADKNDVDKYAIKILPRAYKIIDKFWPGPLTIVLEAPEGKAVGIRMPKNDVALRLLRSVDFPVIAPSANFSGQPAAKDASHAINELYNYVDLILDAGPVELGVESTVIDARVLPFSILREGYMKKEEVLKIANQKIILFVCTGNSCRSVMAEYLFKKKMLDLKREDVEVVSAGTFALFGMGPTHETSKLIGGTGLDATAHRAQRLNSNIVRQADLILTMERRHKEEILRLFPAEYKRVHILGEFVKLNAHEAEISDPIGRSEGFYGECFLKIKNAIDKLAELI